MGGDGQIEVLRVNLRGKPASLSNLLIATQHTIKIIVPFNPLTNKHKPFSE